MELIPKINLTDRHSYVEATTIAICPISLLKYPQIVLEREYFQDKKIILLSIIPDDTDGSFIDFLDGLKKKIDLSKFIITTSDCACYNDQPSWCDEELEYLIQDNKLLMKEYNCSIGLLKGYDALTYEKTRKSLEDHVTDYMIYLTGEIRSNPRFFNAKLFFEEKFPRGIEKEIYLHGCPARQFKLIHKLNCIDVKGVITAQHIPKAVYCGNPHYKRETRIKKEWTNLLDLLKILDLLDK